MLQGQKSIFSQHDNNDESSSSLPSDVDPDPDTDAVDKGVDESAGASERDDEQLLLSIESQSMAALLQPRDNDAIDVVLATKLIQDGVDAAGGGGERKSGYDVLLTQLSHGSLASSDEYPSSLRITTSLESMVM